MSTVAGAVPSVALTGCHAFSNGFVGLSPPRCCLRSVEANRMAALAAEVGHCHSVLPTQLFPWQEGSGCPLLVGQLTFTVNSIGSMQNSDALVNTSSMVGWAVVLGCTTTLLLLSSVGLNDIVSVLPAAAHPAMVGPVHHEDGRGGGGGGGWQR